MKKDGSESLVGTIRVNNVLMPMMTYGCHSLLVPDRMKNLIVRHGARPFTKDKWEHRMSTSCRYDKKETDERCSGCTHDWDSEYVRSLK